MSSCDINPDFVVLDFLTEATFDIDVLFDALTFGLAGEATFTLPGDSRYFLPSVAYSYGYFPNDGVPLEYLGELLLIT